MEASDRRSKPRTRPGKAKIRLYVAEGYPLLADSLATALGQHEACEVVGKSSRGVEALQGILSSKPNIALVDYWIPEMSGAAITRSALAQQPDLKILLLTWLEVFEEGFSAGALGFVPRALSLERLVALISEIHTGKLAKLRQPSVLHSPHFGDPRMEQSIRGLSSLTPRELEILHQMSHGAPLSDLAIELDISLGTLKGHIHNILRKTNARTRMEAVAMARRHKYITEDFQFHQLPTHEEAIPHRD